MPISRGPWQAKRRPCAEELHVILPLNEKAAQDDSFRCLVGDSMIFKNEEEKAHLKLELFQLGF